MLGEQLWTAVKCKLSVEALYFSTFSLGRSVWLFVKETGNVSLTFCCMQYFVKQTGNVSLTSCCMQYFVKQSGNVSLTFCCMQHFVKLTGNVSLIDLLLYATLVTVCPKAISLIQWSSHFTLQWFMSLQYWNGRFDMLQLASIRLIVCCWDSAIIVILRVIAECSMQRFDHEGLCQVQNCFVPGKDLRGRNVVQLQSTVLHENAQHHNWHLYGFQW